MCPSNQPYISVVVVDPWPAKQLGVPKLGVLLSGFRMTHETLNDAGSLGLIRCYTDKRQRIVSA